MAADSALPLTTIGPDHILVGAVLFGALVTWVAIALQRSMSRKKAAHDLVLELLRPDMLLAEHVFRHWNAKGNWRLLLNSNKSKHVKDRRQIFRYLNNYELMAVSIRERVVDETVLKAVIGDKMVRNYAEATALVHMLRMDEGDDEYFEHLEHIAKRWRLHPDVPRRSSIRNFVRDLFGV